MEVEENKLKEWNEKWRNMDKHNLHRLSVGKDDHEIRKSISTHIDRYKNMMLKEEFELDEIQFILKLWIDSIKNMYSGTIDKLSKK